MGGDDREKKLRRIEGVLSKYVDGPLDLDLIQACLIMMRGVPIHGGEDIDHLGLTLAQRDAIDRAYREYSVVKMLDGDIKQWIASLKPHDEGFSDA